MFLRSDREVAPNAYDLDVCGKTRRYKMFGASPGQWLDVTSLYPASALPASP